MATTLTIHAMDTDEIDYRLPEFDPLNPIKIDENTIFLPVGVIGNERANHITGNSMDNFLVGGGGKDTLEGGQGHDMYIVSDEGTVIIETANGGQDMVNASVSFVLPENVENLVLTGPDGGPGGIYSTANLNGTGNALDNSLMGNAGNNYLSGLGGNDVLSGGMGGIDTLDGGAGNDTYFVNGADDVIIEAENGGYDTVWVNNAKFDVSKLKNIEVVKYTKDIAPWQSAYDRPVQTEDYFIFSKKLDAKAKPTKILDFDAKHDTICLSQEIFSKVSKKGHLSKDEFWKGSKAHDQTDRIILDKKGNLFYDADGNGAGKAIKFAMVDPHAKLTASDIILI